MDPRLGQLALQSNAFGGSYDPWVLWVKRLNSRPSFVMVSRPAQPADAQVLLCARTFVGGSCCVA